MRWQKIARFAIAVFVVGFRGIRLPRHAAAHRAAPGRRNDVVRADPEAIRRERRRRAQELQGRQAGRRDPQVRQGSDLQGRPVEARRRHADAAGSRRPHASSSPPTKAKLVAPAGQARGRLGRRSSPATSSSRPTTARGRLGPRRTYDGKEGIARRSLARSHSPGPDEGHRRRRHLRPQPRRALAAGRRPHHRRTRRRPAAAPSTPPRHRGPGPRRQLRQARRHARIYGGRPAPPKPTRSPRSSTRRARRSSSCSCASTAASPGPAPARRS